MRTPRKMVIELLEPELVASLKRKTPEQRLASSFDMWRCARERLNHLLRWQHPEWSEQQIRAEFRRRMLGSK